ncbi:MAG: 2-oxo acid dehydrogenase subunit E2 [Verrucomicrobiota bacterium]|jgi:pyruvate dehydrogenase E2 component (dihydrolipoamide acetyltransferase)
MDLKLPPLGEGVDSGSVVSILVKEGEQVQKGQGIIELETGKAVAPVPASVAGKVTKIIVAVGDTISVGQPILSLETSPAAPAKPASQKPAPAPSPRATRPAPAEPPPEEETGDEVAEPEEETSGPEPAASPTIRRLARELGLNLKKIRGSENGGRIVMADVRAYVERLQRLAAQPRAAGPAAAPVKAEKTDFSKWGPIAKRPMSPLRKTIAQRMSESWNAVPRVTQFDEADITALNDLRKKHAEAYEKKGARLTLTSFVLKIVAETLKKHPVLNTSLDLASGEVIYKEYAHIGIAVDTEQGLIVPVLRDADKKDLLTLSKELNEIAVKTRERKISMEELLGGTFTISNQGGIGGLHFTPIINLPETAILGLGRSVMRATVRDGKIEPRLILPLALSYDHRVIDGGAAVRFMVDLAKGFETFDEKQLG